MGSVAQERLYAVFLMLNLAGLLVLLVTPAVAIYGRVDPTFTGIVVQRYVEYSAFFHFRSSTMIFLLVVLVIGTYGLHTKLLNGTIGDAFSTIGVVFWSLLAFVNTIRMGITHIILQTIDYAVDTELSYNQAVYFAHHLESVSYGFAVINTLSFGLGIFFFALGLSTKNLHRLNRPLCLGIAAIGLFVVCAVITTNFIPRIAGLLYTLITLLALFPMLWLVFLGALFWMKKGRPWVSLGTGVAPPAPANPAG